MKPFWKKKEKEPFEDKPRYKIRADPSDHSVKIQLFSTLKKGMLVDMYVKMSAHFPGEKKSFDELDAHEFQLPEKYLGLLNGKLSKAYKEIESETKKDFVSKGESFRITVLETRSCTFTKTEKNEYEVTVLADGYWAEK